MIKPKIPEENRMYLTSLSDLEEGDELRFRHWDANEQYIKNDRHYKIVEVYHDTKRVKMSEILNNGSIFTSTYMQYQFSDLSLWYVERKKINLIEVSPEYEDLFV